MSAPPPEGAFATLGRTGRRVFRIGFGCYRVDDRVPLHREALRDALGGGVNLIDTSTNYGDGHSEILVGQVIEELASSGRVRRDDLVVVTKAGYVQGGNQREAIERARSGHPWPEMTEYSRDCWHCISPDFLSDQLTASLKRLRLPRVDVLLLHNPEYFLQDAEHRGVALEEAREQYYDRVRRAFERLEQEADAGRIGAYGVSSNTFVVPRGRPDASDLTRMLAAAGPRFQVIQLPMNPLELGAREPHHTADGKSVLEVAKGAGLGVLVNRPLNAFGGGRLTRFAEVAPPFTPSAAPPKDALAVLSSLEEEFGRLWAPRLQVSGGEAEPSELVALAGLLQEISRKAPDMVTFAQVWESYVAPRLEDLLPELEQVFAADAAFASWSGRYRRAVIDGATIAASRLLAGEERRKGELERHLAAAFGGTGEGSIARRTLRGLCATPGVDVVLLGMRRPRYVADALRALAS